MAYSPLAPFDRSRDFIALQPFPYLGTRYQRGAPFDKDAATTRSLRLLYETRAIGYADAEPARADFRTKPSDIRFRAQRKRKDPLDHDGDGRKGGSAPAMLVPEDGAPLDTAEQRQAYELAHTKAQLKAILEKAEVTIDRRWNKTQLVAEIARARRGAAQQ